MAENYLEEKSFFFESAAYAPDLFSVVSFKGREEISEPYEFEIVLVTSDPEIDIDKMLDNPATLYLQPGQELPVHGILSSFEQLNEVDRWVFYRAVLRPRLWNLTLYTMSEVYLRLTIPEIVEEVLQRCGLSSNDFEIKQTRDYRQWSHIVQYQESCFNFISRWMEREGFYYFFEQQDSFEKLIITDTKLRHKELPDRKTVQYAPPSGMNMHDQGESISDLVCRQKPVPAKVILQDFNYRSSPPGVIGEADVHASGRGEVHLYGEHMKDNDEADDYAKIRAEEILCRRKTYHGEGTAPFIRVGHYFEVGRHYRDAYNQKYLLTELNHDGNQAALLLAGVAIRKSGDYEKKPYYENSFSAIEENIQFRAERKTPRPRIQGAMNAKVEAAGNGTYAELDEFGRYKVKLPYDRTDRAGQKATRWIRMAEPFAGPEEGLHFPLRKNAEVLLTHIGGDPDRPIIASAIASEEGRNVVVDQNSTMNLILTSGDNRIELEDNQGHQRIYMSTPPENTYFQLGKPNPEIQLHTDKDSLVTIGNDSVIEVDNDRTINVHNNQKSETDANREDIIHGNHDHTVDGNHTQVVSGNQDRSITGNVTEAVTGNRARTVMGNEDVTITGNHNLVVTGATNLQFIQPKKIVNISQKDEINISQQNQINISQSNKINISQSNEINISQTNKLNISKSLDLSIGDSISLALASALTLKASMEMNISLSLVLEAKFGTTIDMRGGKSDIEVAVASLETRVNRIESGMMDVSQKMMKHEL